MKYYVVRDGHLYYKLINMDTYRFRQLSDNINNAKNNSIVENLESKIVLIEEAGKVFESHVITSMNKYTEKAILVGKVESKSTILFRVIYFIY